MQLTLEGKILTSIITKKIVFKLEECRAEILIPKRRFITKSHKERRIYPFSFIGYLGSIRVTYRCQTRQQALSKLDSLLKIEYIGRFWSEGLGKIDWRIGKLSTRIKSPKKRFYGRVKIHKGLPHHLPDHIQQLLRYAMLHDFVHTPKHKSKIYIELNVANQADLKQHHDQNTSNLLIQTFQKYDRIAARMTRQFRSPRTNRYTWETNTGVDFEHLASELEQHEKNIWRLYRYIYESKELNKLNESLNYGHSSLRFHILLIVNLIVQDYLRDSL